MGGRRALVIIDVQNEFMDPQGNFPAAEASRLTLTPKLQALIPRFRAAGGVIIWVQALYTDRTEQPAGMAAAAKGSDEWLTQATHVSSVSCCKAGTFGAALYPPVFALAAPADAVVAKTGYSAFWETDALKDELVRAGVTEAFFAGLASNTCVAATIIDAVRWGGVRACAVLDCMGWRRYPTHEKAVARLTKLEVVRLVNSEEILEEDGGFAEC